MLDEACTCILAVGFSIDGWMSEMRYGPVEAMGYFGGRGILYLASAMMYSQGCRTWLE